MWVNGIATTAATAAGDSVASRLTYCTDSFACSNALPPHQHDETKTLSSLS